MIPVTPIPTPFDLTALPPLPYQPQPSAWLMLILMGLLAGAIALLAGRWRPGKAAPPDVTAQTIRRLGELEAQSTRNTDAGRRAAAEASVIVRRLVSLVTDIKIESVTPAELEKLASSPNPGPIAAIIDELRELDAQRYSPENLSEPGRKIRRLRDALEVFLRWNNARQSAGTAKDRQ